MAPGYNLATVDVPRQVDEQVTRAQKPTQHLAEISRRDLLANELHSLFRPRFQLPSAVLQVNYSYVRQRHSQVFRQDRQCTLGDGSKTDHQYSLAELDWCIRHG
jgi:hypothetical protein